MKLQHFFGQSKPGQPLISRFQLFDDETSPVCVSSSVGEVRRVAREHGFCLPHRFDRDSQWTIELERDNS